jgi:NAD(P)H-dependent FMN reductase
MKILILSFSLKTDGGESGRVGEYIAKIKSSDFLLEHYSLGKNPIPLWDESGWESESEKSKIFKPILEKIKLSDAFIFLIPEYSGMASPCFKNFILYCNNQDLAHKPAMIIGISSGVGGAYPISEVRSSSYKNTRIVYIPDHVIIRSVESFDKGEDLERETTLKQRLMDSIGVLSLYGKALEPVRKQLKWDFKKFPFGM